MDWPAVVGALQWLKFSCFSCYAYGSNFFDMTNTYNHWFFWAVLSARFAALTAIFARIGIRGLDSDLATLIRTFVILIVLSVFVWTTGKLSNPETLGSHQTVGH